MFVGCMYFSYLSEMDIQSSVGKQHCHIMHVIVHSLTCFSYDCVIGYREYNT